MDFGWLPKHGKTATPPSLSTRRILSVVLAFWHKSRDLACVVHGDDITFCGFDEDVDWTEILMMSWFDVKVRARLVPDTSDDSEVTTLGRTVRWKDWGIEYEAGPRHRSEVLNYFGFNDRTSG